MVEPCALGGAQRASLIMRPASPLTEFQPKLANLLFTYELQRRLMRHGSTIAVAAHPGVADTELARNSPPALGVLLPVGGSDSGVD
jgi:NAD(P)-dependent dehydrogenase (short-subunit alcohol dehydrogenase family)